MQVKLEEYDSARNTYLSLLPYKIYTDEIYHNLGIIYTKLNDPRKAIASFNKVRYNNKKNIDLYYNYAVAWSALGEKDSSDLYLEKAAVENIKWNGRKKK